VTEERLKFIANTAAEENDQRCLELVHYIRGLWKQMPTTADGVQIMPGSVVWGNVDAGREPTQSIRWSRCLVSGWYVKLMYGGEPYSLPVCQCYSSKEAAQAALAASKAVRS
jgi:hypothetical protein